MFDLLNLLSDNPSLPTKFTIALGERIRKVRPESKLSESDLAWDAYISLEAISLIEKGNRSISV